MTRKEQKGDHLMSLRTMASVTGWLFVITFITSIPAAFVLYPPLLNDPNYIISAGADMSVKLGAFLEVILVVANVGTAVVLYPLIKRQNQFVAVGYVAARVVESTIIAVGIISLLSVVTVRQEFVGVVGADAAALVPIGRALVAIHDATFMLGPGVLAPLGNGILLGYLMYRSGLVPRGLAMLGLIGGPLLLASFVGVLFGAFAQLSLPAAIATIPEFVWELSLGIYLIVKGFKPSPILAGFAREVEPELAPLPQTALSGARA
jgi:hypothetical protein